MMRMAAVRRRTEATTTFNRQDFGIRPRSWYDRCQIGTRVDTEMVQEVRAT